MAGVSARRRRRSLHLATTARQSFSANNELGALLATYYFRRQSYGQAVDLAQTIAARDPNNVLAQAILSSPFAQNLSKRQ